MDDLLFSSKEFTDWAALQDAIRETGTPMACESYPDLMFPENGEMSSGERLALQVCQGCPVRDLCFSYGYKYHHQGIWGGTTEGQRKTLRRKVSR